MAEFGYVSLDVQNVDGTKIEAAANKYTFVWHSSAEKYKEKLETKIDQRKGLYHRSKHPIEPEAVFGQIKFNNKFNRSTIRGLDKV